MYVVRADIEAEIDSKHLLNFLDDDNDGVEDNGLFDKLADSVGAQIQGYTASIADEYLEVLFNYLRYCGRILFCALAYRRKGVAADQNPYTEAEKELKQRLDDISKGEISFASSMGFRFLTPPRTDNRFLPYLDGVSSFDDSDEETQKGLIVTMSDGRKFLMVPKYSGGTVTHTWVEV